MCRAVNCRKCRKITWAGCGQHASQVMANVPRADRCTCDTANSQQPEKPKGWLARLFG